MMYMKYVWNLVPDSIRKKLLIVIGCLFIATMIFIVLSLPRSVEQTPDPVGAVQHEADRLKRVTNMIDQKTETEAKMNEKITVNDDRVLDTLESLLAGRAERINQDGR